ncbi:hypothetical protein VFPPC_17578 [Pochonia chlamydosporia 170]|uniref:Uncharacterized protein n=1 Tax=Pochonia chlamydosporia 170 TaxID=1380566 RepID=A0A219ARQ3_METCM|nr:hypothetical protein VFPPC_17578 [Pochonia chlamydosporia 170]OWT43259.1 hypothetical protein VFPPC_17578 [Pochonia chlamydosporia 170]
MQCRSKWCGCSPAGGRQRHRTLSFRSGVRSNDTGAAEPHCWMAPTFRPQMAFVTRNISDSRNSILTTRTGSRGIRTTQVNRRSRVVCCFGLGRPSLRSCSLHPGTCRGSNFCEQLGEVSDCTEPVLCPLR